MYLINQAITKNLIFLVSFFLYLYFKFYKFIDILFFSMESSL